MVARAEVSPYEKWILNKGLSIDNRDWVKGVGESIRMATASRSPGGGSKIPPDTPSIPMQQQVSQCLTHVERQLRSQFGGQGFDRFVGPKFNSGATVGATVWGCFRNSFTCNDLELCPIRLRNQGLEVRVLPGVLGFNAVLRTWTDEAVTCNTNATLITATSLQDSLDGSGFNAVLRTGKVRASPILPK